ncbi:rnd efflux system outer membrane lipoprotein [Pseudomonas sp. M47T1]|nr:efflux transporter outer membrane subunit [Pseudomonas sp. M47T1]EIK97039.1 rnd efflux system outer membrane lipoprotein [Pseudomonas sp. M47T1]
MVLTLTLTISGCISTHGIGPQSRPEAGNGLQIDANIQQARSDAHWPDNRWWQAFGDRQLNTWIDDAQRNSPSLAEAAARVRQAKAMAGIEAANEAPQLNANASITRHKWPTDNFYGPGELADVTDFDNNAALGLSYSLDLWGRDSSATEQALDNAHAAAAQDRAAQLDLQGTIVRSYIQLSEQYAQRDILQALLAQQQQVLDLAQKRFAHGIGTQLEVSQAQTSLPETRRQIDSLDEAIALTGNQLAALAGQGPGAARQLQRPSLALSAPLALPSRLPAQLMGQRPDVVASRWRVNAQARGIEVARAGFYPDVDLSASAGYSGTGGGVLEFLNASKLTGSVGPAVSLPIFDGGRLRAQLGAASAGYDLAVAQYNQTLVLALKDISDQLIRRRSMDNQAALATQGVADAQRSYDIARIAFQRGLTGYLDVLNAQTQLFHEQQVQQQVQAARLQTQASLVIALGGGVAAGKDSPDPARATAAPPGLALLRGEQAP